MKKTLLNLLVITCIGNISNAQPWSQTNVDPNTGQEPYEIASGDIDNDGDIDLVMATYDYNGGTPTQDYIKWYSNDGSGGYTVETPEVSTTMQWIDGLIVVDLNNDGYDDIVATSVNQNKIVYFLSQHDGMGTFTGIGPETPVGVGTVVGPGNVVAGDINKDNHVDLVTISYDNNRVIWYRGDGAGGFVLQTYIDDNDCLTCLGAYYVDVGDFDNDDDLDVVVGYVDSQSIEIFYNEYDDMDVDPPSSVTWLRDTVPVDTGGTFLFVVTAGDVNNDNIDEVVSVDFSAGEVNYFDKIKNGASTKNTICDGTIITNPASVFVADLDNDTLNDVIVTDGGSADEAMIWFKGNSMTSPDAVQTLIFDNGSVMYDITVGDFDNDALNDLDIATIGNTTDTVDWYENVLNVLSINDPTIQNISIYPNPAKDQLNFKGLSNQDYNVSVTDLLGKNILNETVNSIRGLDISNLNSGMYIINFVDTNSSFKFVKE
ncbi:hypothetical protein A9Q87_12315 [Flavobacteriales bacterium 34_180_T64]|nr:hypothetical protein A9Q87_12315 [Flavobacteriales bacterium 34_180_T64]